MRKSRKVLAAACIAAVVAPAGAAQAKQPRPAKRSLHAHVVSEVKRQRADEMASFPQILHRIAECESHGDPRAIGGGGLYRGAFQFSRGAWASTGGKGDPAKAPLLEQYRRAAILLKQSGPGQWPVCAA